MWWLPVCGAQRLRRLLRKEMEWETWWWLWTGHGILPNIHQRTVPQPGGNYSKRLGSLCLATTQPSLGRISHRAARSCRKASAPPPLGDQLLYLLSSESSETSCLKAKEARLPWSPSLLNSSLIITFTDTHLTPCSGLICMCVYLCVCVWIRVSPDSKLAISLVVF